MEDRIKKVKAAHKRVVKAVNELKKLNCYYSDSASDILLFDNNLTELPPEEQYIAGLNSVDVDKMRG